MLTAEPPAKKQRTEDIPVSLQAAIQDSQSSLQELSELRDDSDDYLLLAFRKIDAIWKMFDVDQNGVLEGDAFVACVEALLVSMKAKFEQKLRRIVEAKVKSKDQHELVLKKFMQDYFDEDAMRRYVSQIIDLDGDGKISQVESLSGFKRVVDEFGEDAARQAKNGGHLALEVKRAVCFNSDASISDLMQNLFSLDAGAAGYGQSVLSSIGEIFNRFDVDGNGVLEGPEYENCVNALFAHMRTEFEKNLRIQVGKRAKGVGYDTEAILKQLMQSNFDETKMKQAIKKTIDIDGDGKIVLEEALVGLRNVCKLLA